MTLPRFGWARLAALGLLAGLLMLRVLDPVPVERLRLAMFDMFQRIAPREAQPYPVTIVDIDDPSLQELGQWPWPRSIFAELTDQLMQQGAAAVAFDVIFSEPDRLSPDRIAKEAPHLSAEARAALAELPSTDSALADAFARGRVIVGQTSVRSTSDELAERAVPRKMSYATIGPDPTPFMLRFPGLLQNLPELEEAAAGRGVFTVRPDGDGIYRRVPLVMLVQDHVRLGLSVELLRIATGGESFAIRSNEAGLDGVVVARQLVQTAQDGTVWTYFTPSDPARFVSAGNVVAGRVPPGRLAGQLVLVGTSAIGLEDFRPTPLGVAMPGVEIHAQALENILGGTLLKRPNYAIAAELSLIAALGLIVILIGPMLPAGWLILGGLGLIGGTGYGAFWAFSNHLVLLDPSFPILAAGAMVIMIAAANYLREEISKRQIRSAFGQYVSPDLVAELADNPGTLQLGGERRDLTLLFTDVRGFTSISESFRHDPPGLTALMNRFLTAISNVIMDHKGTIDKFMGDAVMAFWNAPLELANHPRAACEAALDIRSAMADLNTALQHEAERDGTALRQIDIGIGLNTGDCVVGNMGSEARFDYSALGDAVNLASRLEGQTKSYGVDIIIGDATRAAIEDDFATLELDLITVKGKSLPERIHVLLGRADLKATPEFQSLTARMAQMLSAYRAQDWDDADAALTQTQAAAQSAGVDLDAFFEIYAQRITEYRLTPPPPGWDGAYVATSK